MLYNFIQILIFIVAVCCLMSIIFRMSTDNDLVCSLVFGFTGFILSIITFALTIVWAGGWVG